jgi:hypothetical protein
VRISILSDHHINDAFEQNVINIPDILTIQWCDELMGGRDRVVAGFITTFAIGAYHH